MKGGGDNINQDKLRVFRHAIQYLNFHLKTKVGALIGVLKEGYKNIAKMLTLHISPKKKKKKFCATPRLITTSSPYPRQTQKNNFLQALLKGTIP